MRILKANGERKKSFQSTQDKNTTSSTLTITPMPAARIVAVHPPEAPGQSSTENGRQTEWNVGTVVRKVTLKSNFGSKCAISTLKNQVAEIVTEAGEEAVEMAETSEMEVVTTTTTTTKITMKTDIVMITTETKKERTVVRHMDC